MSLDQLVAGAEPALCLPHQCEFLSDAWLDRAREYLTDAIARSNAQLPAFSLTERFTNAPPHLGFADNVAQWSLDFDGSNLQVGRQELESPDILVEADYQAGIASAQVVGARAPGVMAKAFRETKHLFGPDAVRLQGGIKDRQTAELLSLFHDHMARMTVENPDIGHRARALGIDRHIREVEENGYTVIERAITPEFADEVREATLRAVWSHDATQLQWMLYHGSEFEQLVQNASLMTLIDATLGRGAIIASISAIRRGPGPGFIPIHNPTWIVPGSHRERRGPKPGEGLDRGIPIEMPKGSVVYFTHGVWHWQGDRTEPGERVTIHSHFNRGIMRGLEPRRVDVQMIHRNPPRLGEMLGEDDWFDKLDANGRDYLRAGHMAKLQKFTDKRLRELLAG
jgi:hypothetical protein